MSGHLAEVCYQLDLSRMLTMKPNTRLYCQVSRSSRGQLAHPDPHLPLPPTQKPRLGRERGFWFWPLALKAWGAWRGGRWGGGSGETACRLARGIAGSVPRRPGWGSVSVRSFLEGLGDPPSSGGRRESGTGLGPSSGGVPPFDGSRDGLEAARDDVVSR